MNAFFLLRPQEMQPKLLCRYDEMHKRRRLDTVGKEYDAPRVFIKCATTHINTIFLVYLVDDQIKLFPGRP